MYNNGSLVYVNVAGVYWSSTINTNLSRLLGFNFTDAQVDPNNRAYGQSIRCIKN
jgi:hypothetical protein